MKPCGCCKTSFKSDLCYPCVSCKHNAQDHFEPDGKCATCKYDARLDSVCARCIDYDKHEVKK